MSSAAVTSLGADSPDAADRAVLDRVDQALAVGRALKEWWQNTDANGAYAEQFQLIRAFNRPDTSFGFFDVVPIDGAPMPVMGVVEDLLYDQPQQATVETIRDQLREFVLHYFLRVSAFRQPAAYVEAAAPSPVSYLPGLSWCSAPDAIKGGFGFSQHYFKPRESGPVGQFPAHLEYAILDLREIAANYEWIVARVQIYDFNLTFRPLGTDAPQLVLPLRESSYLVISPDFLLNRERPREGVLAEYGFGYAFIKQPEAAGPLVYGPGQFDASFQLVNFRVLDSGEIRASLVFVVNRPRQIANVPLDPLSWGYQFADLMSLGLTSRLFSPIKGVLDRLPLRVNRFDPVSAYIAAAKFLTGGGAERGLCISIEQLEKIFLVQHFQQHYQMIAGSLLTWRQVPDWLDGAALPDWVLKGESP